MGGTVDTWGAGYVVFCEIVKSLTLRASAASVVADLHVYVLDRGGHRVLDCDVAQHPLSAEVTALDGAVLRTSGGAAPPVSQNIHGERQASGESKEKTKEEEGFTSVVLSGRPPYCGWPNHCLAPSFECLVT